MLRDVSKSTLNIMEAVDTCGRDSLDYAIDDNSVIPDSECEQEVLNTDYVGGVKNKPEDSTFSDLLEMDINFAPGSMEVGELRTEEVTPEVEECFRGFERQLLSHVSHSHVSNSLLGSYPIPSQYGSVGPSYLSEDKGFPELNFQDLQFPVQELEQEVKEQEVKAQEEQEVKEQEQEQEGELEGQDELEEQDELQEQDELEDQDELEEQEFEEQDEVEDQSQHSQDQSQHSQDQSQHSQDQSQHSQDQSQHSQDHSQSQSESISGSEQQAEASEAGVLAVIADEVRENGEANVIEIASTSPVKKAAEVYAVQSEDVDEAEDASSEEDTPKASNESTPIPNEETTPRPNDETRPNECETPQEAERESSHISTSHCETPQAETPQQDVSMVNVSMDRTNDHTHDVSMAEAANATSGDTTVTATGTDEAAAAQNAHTQAEDTASQATVSRESSAPVAQENKPEETEGDTTVTVAASVTPENTGLENVLLDGDGDIVLALDGDGDVDMGVQEDTRVEQVEEVDDGMETHEEEIGDHEDHEDHEEDQEDHEMEEVQEETKTASEPAVASFPALPMDTAKLNRERKSLPGELPEKRLIPGEKPKLPLQSAKRPLLDETPVGKLFPEASNSASSKILQPTPRVALTMKPPESLVSSVRATSQPPRQLTPIPDLSHSEALPEDPSDQARLALARKRPLPKRPQGRKISHETTLELQNFELSCKGLADHYRLLDKVGEGTFSSVYLAEDIHYDLKRALAARKKQSQSSNHWKSPPMNSKKRIRLLERSNADIHRGPLVAIKRIYVTSSPKRILNEIKILDALSGYDNISPLLKVMRHEDQILAVLPYFEHQDFRSLYKTGSKTDIRIYITQLCQALKFVHSKDIIHRDIKPTNFLYDRHRRYGVLVDFGLAEVQSFSTSNPCVCVSQENQKRILGSAWELKPKGSYEKNDVRSGRRSNRAGTRGFRAPEVLFKCTCQTTQIDMWSVGVILLSFLCKTLPFFMSHDDADALVELCSIFGRQAMHQTGLLHGAFLELQIPKLRSTGLSFERVLLQAGCPEEWARDPVVIDFLCNTMKLDHHHRFSAEKALAHEFCQRAYEEDDYVDV
ncbi:Cell cycle serine/threonine-protein kinase hsk1 [Yarrowia sp. B02]|nr:Cell cycle serine/threonine-protein kinase hsk1 [Yarrowia sp. B02]